MRRVKFWDWLIMQRKAGDESSVAQLLAKWESMQ